MEDNAIISEWNEANLKMKRLHDAQERINYWKRNPKQLYENKIAYEWWIKDIDVMLGEGKAKYNKPEKEFVERLKKIVDDMLRLSPPHQKVVVGTASGNSMGVTFNENSYRKLINLIEAYEDQVKEYNDKHGLSTKNRGASGLF